jgi:hypothetical protein
MYSKARRMTIDLLKKKGKILALEIFRLVLFPNLTGIISIEVIATFVAYENTILRLKYCRRVIKGSICCE